MMITFGNDGDYVYGHRYINQYAPTPEDEKNGAYLGWMTLTLLSNVELF